MKLNSTVRINFNHGMLYTNFLYRYNVILLSKHECAYVSGEENSVNKVCCDNVIQLKIYVTISSNDLLCYITVMLWLRDTYYVILTYVVITLHPCYFIAAYVTVTLHSCYIIAAYITPLLHYSNICYGYVTSLLCYRSLHYTATKLFQPMLRLRYIMLSQLTFHRYYVIPTYATVMLHTYYVITVY